ncbi:MAG: zinc finger domain-containing protein, partial [Calditrichota bacterium]
IAGIGNIYANEILFRAGINPFRPAKSINRKEREKLFQAIRYILEKAISHFGTTYSAFQTVEGNDGENQNFLKVYQKEGESCSRCGGEIKKVYINNRSTFYCEKCQK